LNFKLLNYAKISVANSKMLLDTDKIWEMGY